MEFDVYEPDATSSPVALILQGVDVPRTAYAPLAAALQAAGLWVVVPDCIPTGRSYLCPDDLSVCRVLSALRTGALACAAAIELHNMVLVGHSAGGVAAFESLSTWPGPKDRPRGIAVFGSTIPPSVRSRPDGPPVLVLCGQNDDVVPPAQSLEAFRQLAWPARRAVILPGLDHFSITRPEGARQIAPQLASFIRDCGALQRAP